MLDKLRATLDGLVNSVQGLNNTMVSTMAKKQKEIQEEPDNQQIRSLQIEIATLTQMVQDMRVQKQAKDNDFSEFLQQAKKMLEQKQRLENFVTPSPPTPKSTQKMGPKTTTTPYNWFTSQPTTKKTTRTTTVRTTSTIPPAELQTFASMNFGQLGLDDQTNVDSGLVSNLDQVRRMNIF